LFRLAVDGVRYVKPETFAIDWVQVRDNRLLEGDESENESYFAYGAKVRSATGGKVVSVRDDMPDETPGLSDVPPPQYVKRPADFAGNHVVVRVHPGVYATYAHLRPGSVAVRVGEEVETGQTLARLGNSGNSTLPHLHFELSSGPDVLTSDSLPYVIDRYRWVGSSDESNVDTGEVPIEGTPRDERRTYPMSSSVTDFR
jgi:murein DD-endopeptidase MepM/ murein hydrolase activator NlpD